MSRFAGKSKYRGRRPLHRSSDRGRQATLDRTPGPVERLRLSTGDELRVGEEQERVELERQLLGVLIRIDRAVCLSVANGSLEPAEPGCLDPKRKVTDRSRPRVHLGRDRGKEAAAGIRALEIAEEVLRQLPQPLEPGGCGTRGLDYLLGESTAPA
jgi:hypothetical protein